MVTVTHMEWKLDLEKLSDYSLDELNRAQMVLSEELKERAGAQLAGSLSNEFEVAYNNELCADPEIKNGLLYAYGAKKKLSATNHICKFVSINDKWVWESTSLVESQNKYSDSDHKLLTLAVVTFQEGDRVDIVESKANIMGHKAKKIASYTISNNKLSKVKNRDITLEAKTGY